MKRARAPRRVELDEERALLERHVEGLGRQLVDLGRRDAAKHKRKHQRVVPHVAEEAMKREAHDVPDQQNRQIGRAVIRPVMVELLATLRAGIVHLQVAPEEMALAAGGAAMHQSPQDSLSGVTVFGWGGGHFVPFGSERDPADIGIFDGILKHHISA